MAELMFEPFSGVSGDMIVAALMELADAEAAVVAASVAAAAAAATAVAAEIVYFAESHFRNRPYIGNALDG